MERNMQDNIVKTIVKYMEKKYNIDVDCRRITNICKGSFFEFKVKIPKYKKIRLEANEQMDFEKVIKEIEKVLEVEGIKDVNFNNLTDDELEAFVDKFYK